MKTIRIVSTGNLQQFEEPIPAPRGNESLLQVKSVGICGSDLHWFTNGGTGGNARLDRPLVLGHEFSGVTEDGKRVAVNPAIPCGTCEQCRNGHPNICPHVIFAGHAGQDGALREWMTWDTTRLHELPESISHDEGTLLEPLGIALHALDLAHVKIGMTVGVFGCGPIGLLIIQLARLAGARQIIATDPLPHRVEAALEFGADRAFQVHSTTCIDELFDATGGRGVDAAFDASGEADAVNTAFHLAVPGGKVMLVGIPEDDHTEFNASLARRKGLTIKMVRRMKDSYPRAIELVASKKVDVASLVTHRFPLDQSNQAFQLASRREGLKIIISV